jgi:hypothetical protein
MARSRSFDSAEVRFAQDDRSFGDENFRLRRVTADKMVVAGEIK